MADEDLLAARFEENRPRMRAVAFRMLGSSAEADDAVQEAWLRLSRSDADSIDNLGGWLTTVVSRVCLDMLRARSARREDQLEPAGIDPVADSGEGSDPEREALMAEAVGPALLVVLQTLTPGERLAFVLHDMFAVPFDEIAPIVGRTPAAARQLASRARRRVQGGGAVEADHHRQREVVAAFLAASRDGDFDALLVLLDPDVVLRADPAAVAMGADAVVRGSAEVAATFNGRAQGARLALVDGQAGAAWVHQGATRVVFDFVVLQGRVVGIELLSAPETLSELDIEMLPSNPG